MNQQVIEEMRASGNYRVVERFTPVTEYHPRTDKKLKIGIYIDTECTGLNQKTDKVIELAMVPFEYDDEGNIYRILPAYNDLQDPGMPITERITQLTGINDAMVSGQSIDVERVEIMLARAEIVVAHNARFDRPFCEGISDAFKNIAWACSFANVNWQKEGIESAKLEYIAYRYNFFYEGHRATIDCQAGIHVLAQKLLNSGTPVLKQLIDNMQQIECKLWAVYAPFEKKDVLKARGYRWSTGQDGNPKAWYTEIAEDKVDNEISYLVDNIYTKPIKDLPITKIDALKRYSLRV